MPISFAYIEIVQISIDKKQHTASHIFPQCLGAVYTNSDANLR